MAEKGLGVGCVIHWKEFEFSNGTKADKFLVLLGCNAGSNYLAVLGTSKPHHKSYKPGCHALDGYYHIPAKNDFFPLDTWLVLADPVEIDSAQILQLTLVEKRLTVEGQLRTEVANAIRKCLKDCPDVSAAQIKLL